MEGKLDLFKDRPLHPEALVFLGRQGSRDVAIKLIPRQENRDKELELHMNLHHSHIVSLFDCGYVTGTVDFTYVVMELCGHNLEQYVIANQHKPLDFEKCFAYSGHILDALSHLQKQRIIHRDLRPSNILLTPCGSTAKITDFKFSKDLSQNDVPTITRRVYEGTNGYRAPELMKLKNPKGSSSSDIFSFGLIVCFMFSKGRHPFGTNRHKWAANIIDDTPPDLSIIPRFVPRRNHLIEMLKACLKHRPDDRWTADKLLEQPFFTRK